MRRNPGFSRLLAALTFLTVCVLGVALTQAAVPSQFIAKMYTEGLGRLPDPDAWQTVIDLYSRNGCNQNTLKNWGRSIYLSGEYEGLGYDNAARVLTLYRGVLNREPDPFGFGQYRSQLDDGRAWDAVVDELFNSAEFQGLAGRICSGNSYGVGGQPALDLPVYGEGFPGGSGRDLQAILDSTPPGETVWLASKAVVRLNATLVIPPNVTLATVGYPPHNCYALMGRLVRESNFADAAVRLMDGAGLQSIWVDGSRGRLGFSHFSINVQLRGGTDTTVADSVISNTAGWSSFHALGSGENNPCGGNIIMRNLVTVYSSSHTGGTWADGLSIACENSYVEDNEIVDATDVGIVLFRATPATQSSFIHNNRILSAGNSAYGALVADPLRQTDQWHDFSGSSVESNTLWTGPNTHFDIALSVGTRAWFGTTSDMGIGASFFGNTTGALTARINSGIVVSGMLEVYVQSNTLRSILTPVARCPVVNVGASVSAGYASGSIQPYTDVLVQGCIGH